jgi:hypothetical protein
MMQETFVTITDPTRRKVMTNFKLIGAAALSLLLASPAVAMPQRDHHRYAYSHRMSPAQHVRNFGYGSPYEAYGFDRGNDFDRGNVSGDFDRRNTFN